MKKPEYAVSSKRGRANTRGEILGAATREVATSVADEAVEPADIDMEAETEKVAFRAASACIQYNAMERRFL